MYKGRVYDVTYCYKTCPLVIVNRDWLDYVFVKPLSFVDEREVANRSGFPLR